METFFVLWMLRKQIGKEMIVFFFENTLFNEEEQDIINLSISLVPVIVRNPTLRN